MVSRNALLKGGMARARGSSKTTDASCRRCLVTRSTLMQGQLFKGCAGDGEKDAGVWGLVGNFPNIGFPSTKSFLCIINPTLHP